MKSIDANYVKQPDDSASDMSEEENPNLETTGQPSSTPAQVASTTSQD